MTRKSCFIKFHVSSLFQAYKMDMTKLNPKCTQNWWNYSFKVPWKHLKWDKIHENPLHENFLILQSLDEHALKNSVIAKLCDF
jgi:hypothetical protein